MSTPAPSIAHGGYQVLMIAGAGRSGSTLLELMLDQLPGVVAVGELTDIWDAALSRNERCGCGAPFAECDFWVRVGEHAFGGWQHVDAERMLALHDSVARNRQLPRLLTAPMLPRFRAQFERYASAISRIYEGIAAVSGCRRIVDASKWPSHAMVLRQIEALELSLAHLVRDPRAVASSWARELERPQAVGSRSEAEGIRMRQDQPTRSAAHWLALNLGVELLAARGTPRHMLSYANLVDAPRPTIASLLDGLGWRPGEGALKFIADDSVRLAPGHGIAGNPSRFVHGEVRLRRDVSWRAALPRRQRLAVELITSPLALAYRGRGVVLS